MLGENDNVSLLHLQAELSMAKVFQARSLQKFSLTLSNHMIPSPVPTSCMVCPVEGSTLPTVFYSVFKLISSLQCKYCS